MTAAEISDRLEIHDLFARYMRAVDDWDEALLLACFTADGVLEGSTMGGVYTGRPGQREFVSKGRAHGADRQTRHLFTNLEAEINGPRAQARAYLEVTASREGKCWVYAIGRYECDLEKHDGQWLIARRRVLIEGHG